VSIQNDMSNPTHLTDIINKYSFISDIVLSWNFKNPTWNQQMKLDELAEEVMNLDINKESTDDTYSYSHD